MVIVIRGFVNISDDYFVFPILVFYFQEESIPKVGGVNEGFYCYIIFIINVGNNTSMCARRSIYMEGIIAF